MITSRILAVLQHDVAAGRNDKPQGPSRGPADTDPREA